MKRRETLCSTRVHHTAAASSGRCVATNLWGVWFSSEASLTFLEQDYENWSTELKDDLRDLAYAQMDTFQVSLPLFRPANNGTDSVPRLQWRQNWFYWTYVPTGCPLDFLRD